MSHKLDGAANGLQFEIISPGEDEALINGARLGRLKVPERHGIDTPNFLAITSRGTIPHVTPDVLSEHLDIKGVHLALEDCKLLW